MNNIDVAIITWHQNYLSTYAGGYVRIREFLKRIPPDLNYILIDNKPSIYADLIPSKRLVEYTSPQWIQSLQKKFFIMWFLLEVISSMYTLFTITNTLVKKHNIKVFYFPIGEFLQLYILSVLLKMRFPHIPIVIDILNYGILDKDFPTYFKRMRKNGIGLIRSMIITSLIFFSYHLNKWTIGHADYVFTVSNALVTKIKKDYKKDTINYTPSGVENDFPIPQGVEKKYLGVFIGRMTMEKGIFEVLHTWADVMKQLPQAQLALAGYADTTMKKTLETEIEKLGLKQHITYFGDVTEEKKKELLSQSHLFLHLARLEPLFPVITILEGFSFGLPAILYDMPVLQETVKELDLPTNCMYTVENGSAVKAAESIVLYTKLSKEEQSQLQRNAKAFADKFDWNTIAHKEFSVISRFVQHVE